MTTEHLAMSPQSTIGEAPLLGIRCAIEADRERADPSIAHGEEFRDVALERWHSIRRLNEVARERARAIALDDYLAHVHATDAPVEPTRRLKIGRLAGE